MRIPRFLRTLSYCPSIRRVVRALHLQRIAREWYYHFAPIEGDILRLQIGGISAEFLVRTPEDLRALESEMFAERHILELLISALHAGDIVYEIGANVGLSTVLLNNAGGQVIAFEPMSENYDRLQDNLKLNGITNVRSFRLALGNWNGEVKLYIGDATGINLGASLVWTSSGRVRYQLVKLVQGDQFRKVENLPIPQVVKIDVEGYEYAVIQGLRQTLVEPNCRLVCCEIHPQLLPTERKPEQVLDLLRSLGFNRIDIYQRGTTGYHALAHKEIGQ